jgi:poly-beta-1,6-N-acetyl-D-glucosamine synthase
MNSVIITTYKEPKTITKAIQKILPQLNIYDELLVTAPDTKTINVAKKIIDKRIKIIKDKGKGKPAALNLAVKKAKGNIIILTDGDVFVNKIAIKEILKPFKDKKTGAVSGHPISIDSKNNRLGFWAYLLTSVAHEIRLEKMTSKDRFFCTGYLFAIRKKLFPKLPENLLSEDGYISYTVYNNKKNIKYSPNSKVYIKYPKNIKDWIIQKKRSAGGYNQIKKITSFYGRSFSSEASGFWRLLKYIKNIIQLLWLIELFFLRLYLWITIYIDINLKNKSSTEIWKRVESTK